jgi:5-formyltetrahydrofolate cyclo-ligase
MSDVELEAQKADARMLMRAERAAVVEGDAALKIIENFPIELAKLSPVAGYWPVGGEIDGRPLLAALAKAGRIVALPRMEPRLILVPLLAFDRAGHRLGQGGGHYDRIISLYRAHGCIAAGLAYAEQEMGLVPHGAHDAHLDWVITPREAIHCRDGLRGRA